MSGMTDNGRKLFIARLKREGRYGKYRKRVGEIRGNAELSDWKGKAMAQNEFGYVGYYDEKDRLLVENIQEPLEVQIEEARIDSDAEELVAAFEDFDFTASDLPEDISFVFHNLHKITSPEDPSSWKVSTNEAPTPGAWNMLTWAASNRTKFMELVIREKLKDRKEDDGGMVDSGQSIDEIDRMLAEIKIGE
jgi:hypothetical protein